MDYNIENYSLEELLSIYNIDKDNINQENIESSLSKSLKIITNNHDKLDEKNKSELIDFYSKSAIKIINSINNNNSNNNNSNNNNSNNNNNNNSNNNILNRELIPGSIRESIPDNYAININKNNFVEGIVNPIKRETITSLLTINSKFRDNYSKNSSTDFTVELNEPYNNVVSIKLASMELINSYYSISEYLQSDRFFIEFFQYDILTNTIDQNTIFTEQFIVPEGAYNIITLIDTINDLLNLNNATPYYNLIQLTYDEIKGKVNFSLYSPPGISPATGYNWGFNINFSDNISSNRPAFLNLGWLLGYRNLYYSFFKIILQNSNNCNYICNNTTDNYCNDSSKYTYSFNCKNGYLPYYQDTSNNILNIGFNPEAVANLVGTHYFLLEVDDFNKNQSEVFRSNTQFKNNYMSKFNYSIFNILGRIPNTSEYFSIIFEDSSDRVFKTRKYFGPVKISKLKIRLLDENGKVINLNNNDIIINLEIETINSSYKNQL